MKPDAMTRLRAANPVAAESSRGKEPVAQAALQRTLDTPAAPSTSLRRGRLPRRSLIVVLAVLIIGVSGALAATDPMGWWSTNPSEAHYRVSTTLRVATPTARQVRCRADSRGRFSCMAATDHCFQIGQQAPFCKLSGTGLPYIKIDRIQAPPRNSLLSRTGFMQAIARAQAAGTMTAVDAAR